MKRALRSGLVPDQTRGGGRARPVLGPPALAELAARFGRFRREHSRGTRIPGDLRYAALAVLENGVAPGELYRTCGVTWGQVIAWKAGGRATASSGSRGAEATDVRVFSVVDEQPACPRGPAISPWQELELRLGPWSVRVQLADPGRVGAGG